MAGANKSLKRKQFSSLSLKNPAPPVPLGIHYNIRRQKIEFSSDPHQDPIVHYNILQDKKFGKHPSHIDLIRDTAFGKPNLKKSFHTEKTVWQVLLPTIKSGFLTDSDNTALRASHVHIDLLMQHIPKYVNIDFTSLREIDTNYASYTTIPKIAIHRFAACAVYYDFHLASVMRYLGNNYTNEHIDAPKLLARIKDIVPHKVYEELRLMLTTGAPAYINGSSTAENFETFLQYGNHSTVPAEPTPQIKKSILKEFKNQWVFMLPPWFARFIPNGHMTPHGLISRPHKKDRLVFDGSFTPHYNSVCINMLTNKANEPEIKFQYTWIKHMTRIWNLRLTYPDEEIFLMADDVAGAFRHCKYNPEIISAFMFNLCDTLCVSTGQNFGTNFAPSNWEAFAKVREYLAEHLYDAPHIIQKHKDLLSLVHVEREKYHDHSFTQARYCSKNRGVCGPNGRPVKTPHHMFVDDNLLADLDYRLIRALAAGFEALFIIFGQPDEAKRKSAIAMDKLLDTTMSYKQVQLGMLVNTRKMTYVRDPKKIAVLKEDVRTWTKRQKYTLPELNSLLGRIEDLSQHVIWTRVLFMNIRQGVMKARARSEAKVRANPHNKELLQWEKSKDTSLVAKQKRNFAQKHIQKRIWQSKQEHFFNTQTKKDIKLLYHFLQQPASRWEVPIAHVVDRDPEFESFGDASLDSGGGFSTTLRFWWYWEWPEEVQKQTLKHWVKVPDSEDPKTLISINLLEYVAIIINYAAATFVLESITFGKGPIGSICEHPYPILCNWADNRSAISWTRKLCNSTAEGRALTRIFASLNFDNPLGCVSQYVKGKDNVLADSISRKSRAEALSTLTSDQQLFLASYASSIESKLDSDNARRIKELGTFRSRQRHYLSWCLRGKLDPTCAKYNIIAKNLIITCYAQALAQNETIKGIPIKEGTIKAYLKAASSFSLAANVPDPQMDKNNKKCDDLSRLLTDHKLWEAEITRREPVSEEMFNFIQHQRNTTSDTLSLAHALADWATVARQAGLRLSEYAQDSRKKLPAGQKFATNIFGDAQGFTIDDIQFFGPKRNTLRYDHNTTIHLSQVMTARLVWRFQKNNEKNEIIWYARNDKDPSRCVVRALLNIRARAQRLHVPPDHPVAVYRSDKSYDFLSNRHIETSLQSAARTVHNISAKKELAKYSSHSYRVMACVLLDTAGMSTDFIKFRLRWKSDAFKMYVRHTPKLAQTHNEATTDCSFLL